MSVHNIEPKRSIEVLQRRMKEKSEALTQAQERLVKAMRELQLAMDNLELAMEGEGG